MSLSKRNLSQDTKDFWISKDIEYLYNPTELEFMKFAVGNYRPVILRNMMNNNMQWFDAMNLWKDEDYLLEKLGRDKLISINLTPDGIADGVKEDPFDSSRRVFTFPCEHEMTMGSFINMLNNKNSHVIPYLSQQNDNFRDQFHELHEDVPSSITLVDDIFDNLEAINLWIGDERSISSLHKDHFENIYAVIHGEKIFTLYPPTDYAFFRESEKEFLAMQYFMKNDDTLELELRKCENISEMKWLDFDPNDLSITEKLPSYHLSSPIQCHVKAGEILYIPSMWYHRVTQSTMTIAINYWYEQNFNFRYVMYNYVKSISEESKDQLLEN